MRFRSALALTLLALFPLVALALVAGLLAAGVALVAEEVVTPGLMLILAALSLLVALAGAARAALRAASPGPLLGQELSRAAHRELWAELDGLTTAMRLPPITRVVVDPVVNAAVVGSRRDGGELMLGLPLLAGLDRAGLRAVVAHELGHLAHDHGRVPAVVYRSETLLEATLQRLEGRPARLLVAPYRAGYLRVAMPVLRAHELAADEWAARLAGAGTTEAALRRLTVLAVGWDAVLDHLGALADDGPLPSPVAGLEDLLGRHAEGLAELAARHDEQPARHLGTHPSGADRVARLRLRAPALPPAPPVPRAAEPAWTLLDGGRDRLSALEAEYIVVEDAPPSWDEAVARSVEERQRTSAGVTFDLLARLRPAAPRTPAAVLAAVRDGDGPDLVRPALRGDLPPAERAGAHRRLLACAVGDVLAARLMQQGRLRVEHDWKEGHRLLLLGETGDRAGWPLAAAVEAAVDDPVAADRLAAAARALGTDLDSPWPAPERPARILSHPVAVLTAVRPRPRYLPYRRHEVFDLIAFDDGLLLHPVPRAERGITTGLRHLVRKTYELHAGRAGRLVDAVAGDPAGWAARAGPPARWIPWADVAAVTWAALSTMAGPRITTRDGRRLALWHTAFTISNGDLRGTLERAVAATPGEPVTSGRGGGGAGSGGR